MPLVLLSRNSGTVDDELLGKIAAALPQIISSGLNIQENSAGHLGPEDIAVRVLGTSFDVGHKDVEVIVFAQNFDARLASLQIRVNRMKSGLQKLLPNGLTGFVWVVLVPSAFAEF